MTSSTAFTVSGATKLNLAEVSVYQFELYKTALGLFES